MNDMMSGGMWGMGLWGLVLLVLVVLANLRGVSSSRRIGKWGNNQPSVW